MFKTLAKHQIRYKGFLFFFLLMIFIAAVASVLMTRLTGDMGQAAINMDMGVLLRFFALITILMVIRAIASAVSALLLGRFAGKSGYRFRDNFARYFLEKPFSAYEGAKSGESLSIFQNDLPLSVELVSNGGIRMIADFIILLVTFVYMIYINWWLTLIFFASFPVLVIIQVIIATPIQKKEQISLEKKAAINELANDSFQNTSTVIAYSLEEIMVERLTKAFAELITATKNAARSFLFLILAGIIASMSPLLIIIAVSASLVISGTMNIGEWLAFLTLAGEAGNWLMMLSQRQNQVKRAEAGAIRLKEHMALDKEDIKALTASGNDGFQSEDSFMSKDVFLSKDSILSKDSLLSFCHVSFSYASKISETENNEPVLALDDVSFEIKKGSRVAFVGGSGSGKSTVLKLLLGLYPPANGEISVMGMDFSEAYAYVPQDSYLFPESILGNITGESTITDLPRLKKACRNAGILEFIESLPLGFDAVLNEAAENVSGGQKQRLALARAFYRDAPVILFDEATSALDPATEALVLQSFSNLAKEKTVVMVAHRPKAIDFCDLIFVMEKGKIVAKGTHDELIKESSVYANLYQKS
ncbi:MAG: ABC transporter ATP-binding protein/permease [Lachnospiraceae bacterium]|nr:ABC transporter ATP-binding protein/permease [Lachnospiraceae bacterium]